MWMMAAASVVGGLLSADAAGDAAETSAEASREGSRNTMAMYRETADRLQPWVSTGGGALRRLSVLTGLSGARGTPRGTAPTRAQFTTPAVAAVEGFDAGYSTPGTPEKFDSAGYDKALAAWNATGSNNPEAGFGDLLKTFSRADFEKDPGYEFRQEEGEKALTRGASARGMAMSTPGLKDLMRFNQGLASSEYGAAYTRDAANKQRTFDYLSYLSGSGQNAAAQVGVAGGNAAASSAALTAQAGQISGQGQFNSSALVSNGISSGVGNYMYQQRYQQQQDMFSDILSSRLPQSSGTFATGTGV